NLGGIDQLRGKLVVTNIAVFLYSSDFTSVEGGEPEQPAHTANGYLTAVAAVTILRQTGQAVKRIGDRDIGQLTTIFRCDRLNHAGGVAFLLHGRLQTAQKFTGNNDLFNLVIVGLGQAQTAGCAQS